MLEYNNDSTEIIYPMLDEGKAVRIDPCAEIMAQCGSHYFFAPGFKTSELVVNGILKRYSIQSNTAFDRAKTVPEGAEVVTKFEFSVQKQPAGKILKALNLLRAQVNVPLDRVIAFYEDSRGTGELFILTKHRIISPYRLDDGCYFCSQAADVNLTKNGVYNLKGKQLVKGCAFPASFVNLFREIKALGQDVDLVNHKHPIRQEPLGIRTKYLNILVDKCYSAGYICANEIIRIEIIARQLGISSHNVAKEISEAVEHLERIPHTYLAWSSEKIKGIPEKYYYVLFHDVATLELLAPNEGMGENVSDFLERIIDKCELDKQFARDYMDVMRRFAKSAYELRSAMEDSKNRIRSMDIADNIYESARFEYHMQEEMLRR